MSGLELGRELGLKGTGVISEYESGHRIPRPARLAQIAKVTGVDLTWLTTGEGSMRDELPPGAGRSTVELSDLRDRIHRANANLTDHNQELAENAAALRDYLARQKALLTRVESTSQLVERADRLWRSEPLEVALPAMLDAVRAQGALTEAIAGLSVDGQALIERTAALNKAGREASTLPPPAGIDDTDSDAAFDQLVDRIEDAASSVHDVPSRGAK